MNISELINNIESARNLQELEESFEATLGKKGRLSAQYSTLKNLSPEDKKKVGGELAQAKQQLSDTYEAKLDVLKSEYITTQLEQDIVDITTPHPTQHK